MAFAFVSAVVLITLAELGDKTQLLVLGMATRYKASHVLAGLVIGSMVVHLLAVAVGTLVGDIIPGSVISVVAGLIFIVFGIYTLRGTKPPNPKPPENQAPVKTGPSEFE